jgi:bifunctional DNase/RNase
MKNVVVADIKMDWSEEELAQYREWGWMENIARIRLVEEPGSRNFDIYIGPTEAVAIGQALSGTVPERPMTHDLFAQTIESLGARVAEARITERQGGTYYLAELELEAPTGRTTLSARPSDAINAALRHSAPILVAEELLVEQAANSPG